MICCRECATLLIDYVDRELSIEQHLQVETHVTACPSCLAYVQSYQRTIAISRKLPEKPLPAELVQRLHQALAPHCGNQPFAPP